MKHFFNSISAIVLFAFASIVNGQNPVITPLTSNTSNSLYSVYCPDSKTAVAVGSKGTILRSTDEGKTWKSSVSATTETLESVTFTNSKTGYAVGYFASAVKTTDGGLTWKKMNTPYVSDFKSVFFVNETTGYISGTYGILLKTTNSGLTWTKISVETDKWIKDIHFTSPTTGIICGWSGQIMCTSNAGVSWERGNSGTENILEALDFTGSSTGYAAGWYGTMLHTSDGGKSWDEQYSETESDLTDICFIDENIGFACGYNGTFIKTTNGGEYWETVYLNVNSDLYSINYFDDNTLLVCGTNGVIVKYEIQDKKEMASFKLFWNNNNEARSEYFKARDFFVQRNYKETIIHLDSAKSINGKNNELIQEMRVKCLFSQKEFAATKAAMDVFYALNPDTASEYYKSIKKLESNIEKGMAEEIKWLSVKKDSTIEAIEEYLKTTPNGSFVSEAQDEKLWMTAKKQDNPMAYDEYLKKQQNGKYAAIAQELLVYSKCKSNNNNVQPYEEYLQKFPKGTYITLVKDSLKSMYLRNGETNLGKQNPEEAEKWFMKYQNTFASADSTNIITAKLDLVKAMKQKRAEDQVIMMKQQQKNQMLSSLKYEKKKRNGKIVKATIWSAVTVGAGYGTYYFIADQEKLLPGILCGSITALGIGSTISSFSQLHKHQKRVNQIKKDIKSFTFLPQIDPFGDAYGMTLKINFK